MCMALKAPILAIAKVIVDFRVITSIRIGDEMWGGRLRFRAAYWKTQ